MVSPWSLFGSGLYRCTHLSILPLTVGEPTAFGLPGDAPIGAAARDHRGGGAGAAEGLSLVEYSSAAAFHQHAVLAELVLEALVATLGADPATAGKGALEDVELAIDLLA